MVGAPFVIYSTEKKSALTLTRLVGKSNSEQELRSIEDYLFDNSSNLFGGTLAGVFFGGLATAVILSSDITDENKYYGAGFFALMGLYQFSYFTIDYVLAKHRLSRKFKELKVKERSFDEFYYRDDPILRPFVGYCGKRKYFPETDEEIHSKGIEQAQRHLEQKLHKD